MEVLLLLYMLHNRGSILKNVPRESVYCVAHRFALPYVLCEDTTSVPCVTWSLRKCHRRYFSEAFAGTPLYAVPLVLVCSSGVLRLAVHRLLTVVATGNFRSR